MKQIPIYESMRLLGAEQCRLLSPHALDNNWQGRKVPWNVRFVLALDPHYLHYHALMPVGDSSAIRKDCAPGRSEFVEGLWEHDVAELFVKSDTSAWYQEINIGPNGNWWSALFSGYRKRLSANCEMRGVETFSEHDQDCLRFGIRIPRNELKVDIGFSGASRLNVTAIVRSPDQEYLIWDPPETAKPDFHLLDDAPCLELAKIEA